MAVAKRIYEQENVAIKACKRGTFMYNVNDMFVGKALDIYGEWCDPEIQLLEQIVREGDIVVDVGAYLGTHTIPFAKMVGPTGAVLAFEPQRLTYQMLCGNMALNNVTNVQCVNKVISNEDTSTKVPVIDPKAEFNYAALSVVGHEKGEDVETVTIDSLNLARCNVLKITVSGMEKNVLEGAEETIKRFKPVVFVDNNHKEGNPDLVQKLFDLDYVCYWNIVGHYHSANHFKNKENIFSKYAPKAHMLCFHRSLTTDVKGCPIVQETTESWVTVIEQAQKELATKSDKKK